MPVEIKIKASIENCVKSQQKEHLDELRGLIKSLAKLGTNPDCEVFKILVKRFIYTVTCIPDNYFLSDVCERVHELFMEFRILLGYFEKGQTGSVRFRRSFEEIVEISSEIYEMFKEFLSDPGYKGTNFPKPGKLKSIRELGLMVKDVNEVLLVSKMKRTISKRNDHISIDMTSKSNYLLPPSMQPRENINNLSPFDFDEDPEITQLDGQIFISPSSSASDNILSSPNESTNSASTSSSTDSSVCSESNLLKSYQTPLAPILFHKDLNLMLSVEERRKSTGSLVDSYLLPDWGKRELERDNIKNPSNPLNPLNPLNPPNPPTSNHGRITYVPISNEKDTVRRCKSVVTLPNRIVKGNLRPPVLVDDDGDILPTGPIPQLRSAAVSIYENGDGRILTVNNNDQENDFNSNTYSNNYHLTGNAKVIEDDDSFIMAYRNRNRSIESENEVEVEVEEGGTLKVEYNLNANNTNTIIDSSNLSNSKAKTMEDFKLSGWSQKNRF